MPELIYAQELDYIPLIAKDVDPAISSSNLMAQLAMTLADAELCVLPCFVADGEPKLRRVLTDEVRLIRSFWLIVHADMQDLARIRYCSDFLAEEVRANRAAFMPYA